MSDASSGASSEASAVNPPPASASAPTPRRSMVFSAGPSSFAAAAASSRTQRTTSGSTIGQAARAAASIPSPPASTAQHAASPPAPEQGPILSPSIDKYNRACDAAVDDAGAIIFKRTLTVHLSWDPRTTLATQDVLHQIVKTLQSPTPDSPYPNAQLPDATDPILFCSSPRRNQLDVVLANNELVVHLLLGDLSVNRHRIFVSSPCQPRIRKVQLRGVPCGVPLTLIERELSKLGTVLRSLTAFRHGGNMRIPNGHGTMTILVNPDVAEEVLPTNIRAIDDAGKEHRILLLFSGAEATCNNCFRRGHKYENCPTLECSCCKARGHSRSVCPSAPAGAQWNVAAGRKRGGANGTPTMQAKPASKAPVQAKQVQNVAAKPGPKPAQKKSDERAVDRQLKVAKRSKTTSVPSSFTFKLPPPSAAAAVDPPAQLLVQQDRVAPMGAIFDEEAETSTHNSSFDLAQAASDNLDDEQGMDSPDDAMMQPSVFLQNAISPHTEGPPRLPPESTEVDLMQL